MKARKYTAKNCPGKPCSSECDHIETPQYTPGACIADGFLVRSAVGGQDIICEIRPAFPYSGIGQGEHMEAYAKLFAAAPELLAYIKARHEPRMRGIRERGAIRHRGECHVCDLIAKAEGH